MFLNGLFLFSLFCSVSLSLLLFCLMNQGRTIPLLAVPRRLFYFGSLMILNVARYLWLFSLYINLKIGKNSC